MVKVGFSQVKSVNSKMFIFHKTQLGEVLAEIGSFYRVAVCNPNHLKGVYVEGTLPKSESLEHIVNSISFVEGGRVFLFYQNRVIYVADKPFPHSFVPDKDKWPCSIK